MANYILAIDQGTTNSRVIIFDLNGNPIAQHDLPIAQTFPHDGWVEQNPETMLSNTMTCCRTAVQKANITADQIVAIGISNQRETTIVWDKTTGKPIYPAIVWQDRRTSSICDELRQKSIATAIQKNTGLLLDPYFSATKLMWLLDNVPKAREAAEAGQLLFGTVDSYLLWHLTDGKVHATDATNASRTMLFNIHTQAWDATILAALNIPSILLPTVLDSAANFGQLSANVLGKPIPITGVVGDQQAATVGQACFLPGMVKATYGTGCFMLLNTGDKIIESQNRLLATVAYRLNGKPTYGLEGSIFSAGVTIKWLRDSLKMLSSAEESETFARSVEDAGGIYFVPAFTGLGAPYWDPHARASIVGMTLNSSREHIVRAALESLGYQTRDLLAAMLSDSHSDIKTLRVDGGMITNNWLLQLLADMLNVEVQRPKCIETTALGAAYLAGLQAGVYQSLDDIAKLWQMHAAFKPEMPRTQCDQLYKGWKNAVARVLT